MGGGGGGGGGGPVSEPEEGAGGNNSEDEYENAARFELVDPATVEQVLDAGIWQDTWQHEKQVASFVILQNALKHNRKV